MKANILTLACMALGPFTVWNVAHAEETKFKLGAHAFFDYEHVEIDTDTPVDGTNLRLFRIDIGGSYGDYSFTSNFDLQNDDITIQDLFVEIKGDTKVRFGNFKVLNGLERVSSIYATQFVEAGSVQRLNGLARGLGVALFRSFDNVHVSAGLFSADVNKTSDTDEWSVSGRVASEFHPDGEDSQLHLGASFRYRESSDDARFGYAQKPFSSSAPSTVKLSGLAESDTFLGLEAAYLKGGLSFQSEYSVTTAQCSPMTCTSDPAFNAYYADVTYTWGGKRVLKDGEVKRTKINTPVSDGGRGAFALSARYDVADLNDGLIRGGKQESFVLGGTWYRDKYVRVLADYTHAEFTDSPSYGDTSADTFVIRLQAEIY